MSMFFTDYVEKLIPTWLAQYWGKRLCYALVGIPADVMAELSGNAVKSQLIIEDECGVDAAIVIGGERQLPRYPFESDSEYKARVQSAWDLWELAGTKTGMENALSQFTSIYPNPLVEEIIFGHFKVTVNSLEQLQLWTYGSGRKYGDPGLYWGTSDPSVKYLRDIIKRMKPADIRCDHIIIIQPDTTTLTLTGV